MKISEIIKFLERVRSSDGDIRMESITGFWVRTCPRTGEKVVVPSVGDGKTVKELIDATIQ